MAGPWKTGWQRVRRNLRNRLASGMIVLVPIGVTLLVMRWVLGGVVALFQPLVEKMAVGLSAAPDMAHIPVQAIRISLMIVSILGFLLAVYLTGAMAHVMVGRRLIRAGEGVLMRVPLASTIYMAAKQVIEAVAAPTQSAFRTVVLVEFPRQDAWSIGFLTGRLGRRSPRRWSRFSFPPPRTRRPASS
ncbi:MAG: DUF502 domain-containing protein [Planctomycetes bacterium]|nr:DUF502 domain-containing protein [Planctomycetota bacterium]